jgi:hypothetical protein
MAQRTHRDNVLQNADGTEDRALPSARQNTPSHAAKLHTHRYKCRAGNRAGGELHSETLVLMLMSSPSLKVDGRTSNNAESTISNRRTNRSLKSATRHFPELGILSKMPHAAFSPAIDEQYEPWKRQALYGQPFHVAGSLPEQAEDGQRWRRRSAVQNRRSPSA